jgi:hypothetical protein
LRHIVLFGVFESYLLSDDDGIEAAPPAAARTGSEISQDPFRSGLM